MMFMHGDGIEHKWLSGAEGAFDRCVRAGLPGNSNFLRNRERYALQLANEDQGRWCPSSSASDGCGEVPQPLAAHWRCGVSVTGRWGYAMGARVSPWICSWVLWNA